MKVVMEQLGLDLFESEKAYESQYTVCLQENNEMQSFRP